MKRITKPMMGFKSLRAAGPVLTGIELMNMILKGQMNATGAEDQSPAEQFYSQAA